MTMSYRCTFIHAPDRSYSKNQNYGVEFMPSWVFTLVAHIPEDAGFQLSFFDMRFDEIGDVCESDLFLFSGINQDLPALLETQGLLKQKFPKAKFIVGGPICWSFNQSGDLGRLFVFDHIHVGDGEAVILELIQKIRDDVPLPQVIKTEQRFPITEAKALDRKFLKQSFDRYYGVVIEVSRGCPFLCEFCDIRIMTDNNKAHNKNPQLIVDEIEFCLSEGKQQFILACDNFIGDQQWAEEVCDQIIAMQARINKQPRIYTWLTINIAKNVRLMTKMRQAGFELLFIGVESFNVNSLIETAKVQNTARLLIDDIQNIQSFGFIIVAGLIFGFDTDEEDCFDITLNGLKESGLLSGDPSFLTALPGTPLYRRMKLSNRLRVSDKLSSSTSTGGVKYQTNIKYLIPKEAFIFGFKSFVNGYNNGKFQFARLKVYFDELAKRKQFVPLKSGGEGFGSLRKVLGMIVRSPSSFVHLLKRGLSFCVQPTNIYYALKGIFFVMRQTGVPGRANQLQFWLFAWSNYVMKYQFLKASDFDIESVDDDFDVTQLIPGNYRETATEQIPQAKIDAQVKATQKGLSAIIEKRQNQGQTEQNII